MAPPPPPHAVLGLCVLVLGTLARPSDEEWVDPTDMLRYDAASKTMRRECGSARDTRGGVTSCAVDRELQAEDSAAEHSYQDKLCSLQKEIKNLKHRVDDILAQEDLILDPESKLTHLLHSIQQLSTILLLMISTYITQLSVLMLHSSSSVTPWLLCTVATVMLICILLKRLKKNRDQHEQPRANNRQGCDDPPNIQNDDQQPDDEDGEELNHEHPHSLENPINVVAEVLDLGRLHEQSTGAAQQVLESMADECCDENYEITKEPTTETSPAWVYSSEQSGAVAGVRVTD